MADREFILKYDAGVYQRKITALQGYYGRLNGHLEQLTVYHGQMKDFWDGSDESDNFYKLISEKINEVKKAMEDCLSMNLEYQKVVDELTNTSGAINTIVDDIATAAKEVVDVAGDVAKIAALL